MSEDQNILILIVDDEPVIRWLACESLSEAGFEVLEASNAEEALTILKSRSDVGALFTDVNMPGSLNGLELAELVHRRWPAIKLIVTSGRALEKPVPDDGLFLPKPYLPSTMTHLIAEAVEK